MGALPFEERSNYTVIISQAPFALLRYPHSCCEMWCFAPSVFFITNVYKRGMAHEVCRRGYWSLEESYRDESGKPRKRVIEYYGKKRPIRLRDISFRDIPGEGAAAQAEWDAIEAGKILGAPSEPEPLAEVAPESGPAVEANVGNDTAQQDANENDSSGGEQGGDGEGEGGH